MRLAVDADDGRPVALGAVRSSRVHPSHLWCHVEVAPDHRQRGVGRLLLAALGNATDGRPLAGRVERGSEGEAFAVAVGFSPAMGTRVLIPRIP